jgi:hypothetical protein
MTISQKVAKGWFRKKLQMQGAQKIITVRAIHESPLQVR